MRSPAVRAAAVCLVAAAQACSSGGAPGASTPSAAELEALYRARTDSALARYTDADADFMRRMIGHHGQALEMARLAPSSGAGEVIRRLAARVIAAQESEIALMRQWLEARGLSAPEPHAPTATDSGPDHPMDAPGMLTPEQMEALSSAHGAAFDRLFLELMIQHHEGAVAMVERLFATPGAAQDASVFRIASGIQVDQRTEIARMQSMLDALGRPGGAS